MRFLQSKMAGKGPHAAAAAQALHTAAQKPPTRVLFKAAAKVLAPEDPAAAIQQRQSAALAKRLPSQKGQAPADELSIEVGICCALLLSRTCMLSMHAAICALPAVCKTDGCTQGHGMHLQEKLWRLRAKRAWIREQLRAQRGFSGTSDDASYAEPWAEAFGMCGFACQ